jgi:D-glycero-D-manno-heptose 1,7-bisphosphate phosphatase
MKSSTLEACRSDLTLQGIRWRAATPSREPRAGLILDRDGVLVNFVNYLHRPGETRLADGAAELVGAMRRAGVAVGVATNQAGVDRLLYAWHDYFAVESEIERQLSALDTALDGVAACPYHPDFTKDWSEHHAYWRKPGPGMIELLIRELNICRERCWMIGDHSSDIGAAKAAGLPGAMLIMRESEKTNLAVATALATPSFQVNVITNLLEALPLLIERLALPVGTSSKLQAQC